MAEEQKFTRKQVVGEIRTAYFRKEYDACMYYCNNPKKEEGRNAAEACKRDCYEEYAKLNTFLQRYLDANGKKN